MAWLTTDTTWSDVRASPPPASRLLLSPEEQAALRPPSDRTVSEWADLRRVLQTATSRVSGLWRTATTPYLRTIMDTFNNPGIRHVTVCAGTQIGKTEAINNILGYIIDEAPRSVLLVYPREDDAKTISRTRLDSMLRACPTLAAKIPEKQDLNQLLEKHFPGMILYLVGANSPAGLASKPCPVILRDEVGKFPTFAGDDADPLSLSEARAKSFWDVRKIYDVSSPTVEGAGISKQLASMDVIYRLQVPCPRCGLMQFLEFGQVKWKPAGEGEDRFFLARTTAVYECEGCGFGIDSSRKSGMLAGCKWVPDRELAHEPERVGFDRLSSLYSPFLSFGAVAEQFLRAKAESDRTKAYGPLQDFINGWLAEPWKNIVAGGDEWASEIRSADGHKQGTVPESAVALTCTIDVQANGFWYKVRAWARDKTSWLVDCNKLATWGDVERMIFDTAWPVTGSDSVMRIWRAGIDTGGARTEETYFWLRKNGHGRGCPVIALKGSSHGLAGKIQPGAKLDRAPSGKLIPGGIQLFLIDTDKVKDEFWYRVKESARHSPGALWVFENIPPWYVAQVTAEVKDRDRHGADTWRQIGSRDNHMLDCECMGLAIADPELWGGVGVLAHRAGVPKPPEPPQPKRQEKPDGGWISGDVGNWVTGGRQWSRR